MHYGLVLPHRPLSYSPSAAAVQRRLGQAAVAVGAGAMSDPTPAALLRVYIAAPFLLDYPEEAVDYLVSLDSNWQAGIQGVPDRVLSNEMLHYEAVRTAEFSTLLTTVGRTQLTKLVGSLEAARGGAVMGQILFPGRSGGYLDRYLPPDEVNILLAKAAHFLLTQSRDSQGAVYAFQLAGRFDDALEEMICQLGVVFVTPTMGLAGAGAGAAAAGVAAREQWILLAKTFRDSVLGGRMQLAPLLQRLVSVTGRIDTLTATLEAMLHLCTFVDHCCQLRYRDALGVLDAMDFRFDDRLVRAFGDLHRVAQQSFDFVLHRAMDCVKQLFSEARRNGDVAREEAGLRKRADDIAKFANAVRQFLQPSTSATLNRVQVGLV